MTVTAVTAPFPEAAPGCSQAGGVSHAYTLFACPPESRSLWGCVAVPKYPVVPALRGQPSLLLLCTVLGRFTPMALRNTVMGVTCVIYLCYLCNLSVLSVLSICAICVTSVIYLCYLCYLSVLTVLFSCVTCLRYLCHPFPSRLPEQRVWPVVSSAVLRRQKGTKTDSVFLPLSLAHW